MPKGNCRNPGQGNRHSVQSAGGGGGEKWEDSGYILKAEPEGFLQSFSATVQLHVLSTSDLSSI